MIRELKWLVVVGLVWVGSASRVLGVPPEDGVPAVIEMKSGRRVSASWYDTTKGSFQIFWNPAVKSPVVKMEGEAKYYPFNKMDPGARQAIDNALRFAGHEDAATVAKAHSLKHPLKVDVMLLVGVGPVGEEVVILLSSATPDGLEAARKAMLAAQENFQRNEPGRRLERELQATRRAADRAAAEAQAARRAARDAEAAAFEAESRARRSINTLRGLGIIP